MKPAEAYILKQKEPYRSIMMHLQAVIEHSLSDAELKYKWRLPCFYIGKRPICYINQSKVYVDVGFWGSFSKVGSKEKNNFLCALNHIDE